ncbi:MAG: hypothetical protein RML72_09030 [Bacteroidia bacterium]|nr:hypothetical protein [Bacteroidia bacterium]MDW8158999.1 hypothetical protein [Bacteroidia bacterium]
MKKLFYYFIFFLFILPGVGINKLYSQQSSPRFSQIYNPTEVMVLYMFDHSWNEDSISTERFNAFINAPSQLQLPLTDFVGAIIPKKVACFVIKTKNSSTLNTVEQKLKQKYPTANFRRAEVAELDNFIQMVGSGFKYNNQN